MRRITIAAVFGVALAGVVLVACGGSKEVTLTATDFRYSPEEVTVKAGQEVQLVVANRSATKHNFHIDGQAISVDVDPGQTQTLTWKVPQKAGEIDFGCEYHEDAGMMGQLTVQ